jgi:signal transduction histidine kinase
MSWSWFRRFEVHHAALLVVVVGVLTFLVGDGVVVLIVDRRLERLATSLPVAIEERLRTCDHDPASWRPQRVGNVRVDAYDQVTFAAIAGGPPLAPVLLQRFRAGDATPRQRGWLWGRGSAVVVRAPVSGRCGVVQLRRDAELERDIADVALLAMVASLAAGLAIFVSYLASMRRVLARLRRVRRAASTVAHAEGYVSASDGALDDIGEISRALDDADSRIRRDAVLIQQRGEELEHHLADVAHDVRTPLAALQLALESAARSGEHTERTRCIHAALADAAYLAGLLENLQIAARISSGIDRSELATSLVDLSRVVEMMELRFGLLARKHGIELAVTRPDDAVALAADALLIERAVSNVVHNAIVHGRDGGHVAVLLERASEGRFLLSISDDGPGMAPAMREELNRAPARPLVRPRNAAHLGMAIACAVFQRAECVVRFQSNNPVGLCVEISGREHVPLSDSSDSASS